MTDRRRLVLSFLFGVMLLTPAPGLGQVTIFFDGNGPENEVTEPGATSFSFMGSNWSGGVVRTEGIVSLYASGRFSYEIAGPGGSVTFDGPVDSVRFFYVHGFGFAPGSATAFDDSNNPIGMAGSRAATSFADPGNFVTLDPRAAIARVEFSGGVIDNFAFTAAARATQTPTRTDAPPSPSTPVPTATRTPAAVTCVGDCNDDGTVTVAELVRGVNIALENLPVAECPAFDTNADNRAAINELVAAVAAALAGCR